MFSLGAALGVVYWRDPRIHQLGNHGWKGALHASLALPATYLINSLSYGGEDVRRMAQEEHVGGGSVVDLGCGVGMSTREGGVGVDASEEMVRVGKKLFPGKELVVGNAEWFGEEGMCDVCTSFFLLHEAPPSARGRIVRNAARIAREKVVVLDISPDKMPSRWMLEGEPYLEGYLSSIEEEMRSLSQEVGGRLEAEDVIERRARCWVIHLSRT